MIQENLPISILLADDDLDDRFFFDKVLKKIPHDIFLNTVKDGEELMQYLYNNVDNLPDILFLDFNMPRKNGAECLSEIKASAELKELQVIMYSTYLHEDVADVLYENGAHFYIRKTGMDELNEALLQVFSLITDGKIPRPEREHFILQPLRV